MKNVVFILVMVLAAFARAAGPENRALTQSAVKDAVDNLNHEVGRSTLIAGVTVSDFLRETASIDEMNKVLQRAEQLGGPRWIDDRTCEVELQISGAKVGQAIQRIAAANPKSSPIKPAELERIINRWNERTFSATGTATSALPVARVPNNNKMINQVGGRNPWANVPQIMQDAAIASAKLDAARRSLTSVTPVMLTQQSTVGDVLSVKEVGQGMENWFLTRPVSRVDMRDDLQVEVALTATPVEVFDVMRGLAGKQKKFSVPADEEAWLIVREGFQQKMLAPIGRGVAPNEPAPDFAPRPFGLMKRAPNWVNKRIETEGSGSPAGSKLLAARAAESVAETKLVKLLEELQLTRDQTVGQAAKSDKRIAQAISRAAARARIGKADYREDGSATVQVYLDLEVLWNELRDLD